MVGSHASRTFLVVYLAHIVVGGGCGSTGSTDTAVQPVRADQRPKSSPSVMTQQPDVPMHSTRVELQPTEQSGSTAVGSLPRAQSRDLVGALFGVGQEVTKALDDVGQQALALSPEECRRVGAQTHTIILSGRQLWQSPGQVARVERLLGSVQRLHGRAPDAVYLTLLDAPEVNAFSHVGGYIYVYRGLLELVASDDELLFVIAHELAHLELGHCTRLITYSARASEMAGDAGQLAQFTYSLIARGYSEEQEFAADAWALGTLRKLGHSEAVASSLLERFGMNSGHSDGGASSGSNSDVVRRTLQELDRHLRTHPLPAERIAHLKSQQP